jgi:hypothetical protein
MAEDMIFGGQGIDTPYEREKIDYDPKLEWPVKESTYRITDEVMLSLERTRDFQMTRAVMDYNLLISQIEELLKAIENRNQNDKFRTYKVILETKSPIEVTNFERENSGHLDTGDFEIYTILFRMKASLSKRVDFLSTHFLKQIAEEDDVELVAQKEQESIADWEKTEIELGAIYEDLAHDEEIRSDSNHPLNKQLLILEHKKRELENLHVSLADTSYVHRNRFMMFFDVVQQAATLIHQPQELINQNLNFFMFQVNEMKNFAAIKTHLLLSFRQMKDKHHGLKGKYLLVDDNKEEFISEKQYMYQQIKNNANDPIRTWLYDQEEEISGALDLFASLIVDSVERTHQQYDDSLADSLKFYKKEAIFYDQQISLLEKKEQIRLFFRIIEDLEDEKELSEEWVTEYLESNGYQA